MPDNMKDEYKFKPKRKGRSGRTYIILAAGIIIGIFATAILGAGVLFIGSSDSTVQSVVVESSSSTTDATAVPFEAQQVELQPTVIAERIQAAAISPDGAYMAISSDGANAQLQLTNLAVERNLTGEHFMLASQSFDTLTFSDDSTWLLATNRGPGVAHLYNVRGRVLADAYNDVVGGGFSDDGDTLVLVERNDIIRVLDVSGAVPNFRFVINTTTSTANTTAVAVSNDDRVAIASGTEDTVAVYNLNSDAAPVLIPATTGYPHALAFTPDDAHLGMVFVNASAQTSQIIIYNFDDRTRQIFDYQVPLYDLAFDRSGDWLVVGGGQSGVGDAYLSAFLWGADNTPIQPAYTPPLTFDGHSHTIYDVGFTPEGYVYSAGWDGSVRLWDRDQTEAAISIYLP